MWLKKTKKKNHCPLFFFPVHIIQVYECSHGDGKLPHGYDQDK